MATFHNHPWAQRLVHPILQTRETKLRVQKVCRGKRRSWALNQACLPLMAPNASLFLWRTSRPPTYSSGKLDWGLRPCWCCPCTSSSWTRSPECGPGADMLCQHAFPAPTVPTPARRLFCLFPTPTPPPYPTTVAADGDVAAFLEGSVPFSCCQIFLCSFLS